MTDDNPTTYEQYRLLQSIARSVTSIDRNLERIVEGLDEHLDNLAYDRDWAEHGYDLRPHDRYGNCG